MSAVAHTCRESSDPRHAGYCPCGRRITISVRHRSLDFERQFTEHAAKGVADASRLIEHSEARMSTLSGPYVADAMLVQRGRNLIREVREELADSRAYLCWLGEECQSADDDDGAHRAMMALRHIVLAYNLLLDD